MATSSAPLIQDFSVPHPRQNRVTPTGDIIATPARGTFMGNRGCIHNAHQQIVRRWKPGYYAWITCLLEFKGRKRPLMQPRRYTELFFLDEATAFAAGHRPCGECRRTKYAEFMACWRSANAPIYGSDLRLAQVDHIIHRERLDPHIGHQITYTAPLDSLSDGTFIKLPHDPDTAYLVWNNALHAYSPAGYTAHLPRPGGEVTVLTPQSIVRAFAAGYSPVVNLAGTS